jgi:hypothetical protein
MATQTRRTTQRSVKFLRATGKASMVTVCCGLVLLSAIAAHAGVDGNGLYVNGMPFNGAPINGMPFNGMPYQGLPTNGLPYNGLPAHEDLLPTVQNESLPWSTMSQQGVGKHQPPYCKGPLCRP